MTFEDLQEEARAAIASEPATQRENDMVNFIAWLDYRFGYKLAAYETGFGEFGVDEGLVERVHMGPTLRGYAAEFIAAGAPADGCSMCHGTRFVAGQLPGGIRSCPECTR